MRLEDVTAEIRPRTDWEAVDLGFAMVRRDFWRCFVVWWLAMLVPCVLAAWLLMDLPLLLIPLLWWWKPAGSRMVLFDLSRRLFGEKPTWKMVLLQIPGAWSRRFFYRFVWARFSPWLPVTLAIEDLEGLRRGAYRQRASQLALRGDGITMWMFLLADAAAAWVAISVFLLGMTLIPEGMLGPLKLAVETFDISKPHEIPPVISWTAVICTWLGMSLTDLFVTGAGFGIYVNNRTWLEGWDVELAFKRLGKRLAGTAVMLAAVVVPIFCSPIARAQGDAGPNTEEVIREVKSHPDFKVHEETYRVPKEKPPRSSSSGAWFSVPAMLGKALGYLAIALLIGLLVFLLIRHGHVFRMKPAAGKVVQQPRAKVVMGMQINAESLPKDIPTQVLALWREGKHHEALALLYRGGISKVIDRARVDIQESDTEGDCLRRIEAAGNTVNASYFRSLTGIWMGLAYAGVIPKESEVVSLCNAWPYEERRGA
jgi:hypothetical protein